jgi:hypothetical protein
MLGGDLDLTGAVGGELPVGAASGLLTAMPDTESVLEGGVLTDTGHFPMAGAGPGLEGGVANKPPKATLKAASNVSHNNSSDCDRDLGGRSRACTCALVVLVHAATRGPRI